MIYFPPMCGTDPRRRNSTVDRLRARNLRWLQRLIKEEWINLEHDINNMTLTALLKPVLLSINSLSRSLSLSFPLRVSAACWWEADWWLWNTDQSSQPCYCDSQSIRFRTGGGVAHLHIATGPFNCLAFGHHRGYRMYRVQSGGSHSAR